MLALAVRTSRLASKSAKMALPGQHAQEDRTPIHEHV
jgi:hypothetical protein